MPDFTVQLPGGSADADLARRSRIRAEAAAVLAEQAVEDAITGTLNRLAITGPLTLTTEHLNMSIEANSASRIPITVPTGLGAFICVITQRGAGQVYPVWADGLTVVGAAQGRDRLGTAGQGTSITLYSYDGVLWYVGGQTAQAAVPGAPTLSLLSLVPIPEHTAGTYAGFAAFAGADVVLSIDPDTLDIDQTTGRITTATADIDYDALDPDITVTVTATNAGGTDTIAGSLSILDIEPPEVASGLIFAVLETAANGTVVGRVSTVAGSNRATPTGFELVGGPYSFTINSSGDLIKQGTLNAGATPTQTVQLRAISVEGPSATVDVTVAVVGAAELYDPAAAGAAHSFDVSVGANLTTIGTPLQVSQINSTVSGSGFWLADSSTQRPLYEASGPGGFPVSRWDGGNQRLRVQSGNPVMNSFRNAPYMGFEFVAYFDNLDFQCDLLRLSTSGSTTTTWMRTAITVEGGVPYLTFAGRALTSGNFPSRSNGLIIETGRYYYGFVGANWIADELTVQVNGRAELFTSVGFAGAGANSADVNSSLATLGRPASTIDSNTYWRMPVWSHYSAEPDEETRQRNAVRLMAKYGIA